jgi:hypothetical protein
MIPLNSAMNMNMQNMNVALGSPNLQLYLPPNRMQRAALGIIGISGMGPGAGMGVNGMHMNGMPLNGRTVVSISLHLHEYSTLTPKIFLQQAQYGMFISHAPSVHPGMHPMMHPGMNGMNGIHMCPQNAMSPIMRPPSTAPSNSGACPPEPSSRVCPHQPAWFTCSPPAGRPTSAVLISFVVLRWVRPGQSILCWGNCGPNPIRRFTP